MQKPIDELARVVESKIGALWNYASNIVDMDGVLAPGYFNTRFPDRQMRTGDKVDVAVFAGEKLQEIATLVVVAVEGKQVTVKKIGGMTL